MFLDYHAKDPGDLLVPPEVFLGRNIREVLPPELAAGLERCFNEAMATGGPCALEYPAPSHGDIHFYEARVVRCDSDKVLSVVRDITERIRAEDEVRRLRDALAHVGRVSMLGALTGSLAHEINQPLAAIGVNAQAGLNLVASGQTDVDELREAMRDIIADSRRAGDVLHRLRELLTKGTTKHAPLDVTTLIDEVLRLVRGEIVAHRIQIEVDLEDCVPFVLGDRVQIQQVVLNLLINAFEGVRQLDVAERRVILRMRTIGTEVVVSVGDNGIGLSEEELPQIFEPFYTTKPGRNGSRPRDLPSHCDGPWRGAHGRAQWGPRRDVLIPPDRLRADGRRRPDDRLRAGVGPRLICGRPRYSSSTTIRRCVPR